MTDTTDTVTSAGAALLCGVSRSTFNEWVRLGTLPEGIRDPASYNGRARYKVDALRAWAQRRAQTKP